MRIVVGGQIDKENVAKILKEEFSDAQIDIKSDIDAAMEMKLGNYDYYFGACNTGGGGALAMAIAILGANICLTVASPGTILTDEEVEKEIKSGKKAFGFTHNAAEKSIKMIKKYL